MLRFLVCSFAGALVVCASARAQSVPVNVTNTAAHPVPTTITNAPSVTVANPVQVSGPVQVTGNVGLTGAPAVTISGTPTVLVGNLPPGPGVGDPIFDTVQARGDVLGDSVGAGGTVVPAGKRRTITMISAVMVCPIGQSALGALIGNGVFYLPLQQVFTDVAQGRTISTMMMQTNFIAVPGAQFFAMVESDTSNCILTVNLWGVEALFQP